MAGARARTPGVCSGDAPGYPSSAHSQSMFMAKRPGNPPGPQAPQAVQPTRAQRLQHAAELYRQGKYPEVMQQVERVLQQAPDEHNAWHLGAATAFALGALDDAELMWRTALVKKPDFVEAHYNLGVVLYQRGRHDEAETAFRAALALNPRHARALNNLGALLRTAGNASEAEAMYRRSLDIEPDNAECMNNLSVLLLDRQCNDQAEVLLRRAVALSPHHADVLNNLARVLARRQCDDEAAALYRRALTAQPDHADSRWGLGLLLLRQGHYAEAWPLYEARLEPGITERNVFVPKLPFPQWQGEPLQGRSVLVWYEQGYGDEIQFCRYVALLKVQGAGPIGLVCKRALVPLFETLHGVDTVYPAETTHDFPAHDYWVLPMSLPLRFGTRLDTIPATLPYLSARADRMLQWRDRLPQRRPRVGLVWQGNPGHRNDGNRSLPSLSVLAPLATVESAEFVGLQFAAPGTVANDDATAASTLRLLDLGQDIRDFGDTAAIIRQLDLVICVDTSTAHLAGALNTPCWVLLPFLETDWRWLLAREDSPWYPEVMRLFRQTESEAGDWSAVIGRVTAALRGFVADYTPPTDIAAEPSASPTAVVVEQALTDIGRWQNAQQLDPAWAVRSERAAALIPAGARVLDFGCGAMNLERYLPWACSYQPSDVVARDACTLVCDLNSEAPPAAALAEADVVTMMGVLEYIHDPQTLLRTFCAAGKPLICSYCGTERTRHLDRRALGWINEYSSAEFIAMAETAGYALRQTLEVDAVQQLFRFEPRPEPGAPPRRVHVLAFHNAANFGDRLGYHLLNDLMPANAVVSWGSLRPLQAPPADCDLVVLGIGNSLFGDLLSDELIDIATRFPTIGVFGTQYRDAWPPQRLHALLDVLQHWYARYEEDVLIYGRGRTNVSHLGDWLIRAFPLAQAELDERLVIGPELAGEASMDRLIQHIQKYRNVYSTRLHPLLCALTSAQTVAYREQRELSAHGGVSGKFRSLLLDVFGRAYPEDTEWPVDRDAVLRYKQRVNANVDRLAADLRQRLTT